jgi:hypothetical protein
VSRVYIGVLNRHDPRLGRKIRHDPKSWGFAYPTAGLSIASVRWPRQVLIFDQGQVGSCTGNAGIGVLCTGDLWPMVPSTRYTPDEAGAVNLYSDAESANGDGPYPPNDDGSDGLTVAKVLKSAGMISAYRHTFTINDALKALTQTPLMTGIAWYANMFTPDREGIVTPGGALAGGHEIVVDEYDARRGLVGFSNSWGVGWGQAGRFYLDVEEYAKLLDDAGDVTALLPVHAPAPPPGPVPDDVHADRALAQALRLHGWVGARHVGENHRIALAGQQWLAAHPDL